MGRLNKLFRRLQVNPNWLNWINRAVAHPTLGNRPVPASPYPRECQSFASHANTRRVIPPFQSLSLASFRGSFFLSALSCPLLGLGCLVREFSWLAKLTAFGKIGSSTVVRSGYQRGSHKKLLPSLSNSVLLSRSDSSFPILDASFIAVTSFVPGTGYPNLTGLLSFAMIRGDRRVCLPLLEPVSRAHVTRWRTSRPPLSCLSCQFAVTEGRGRKRRRRGGEEEEPKRRELLRGARVKSWGSGECCVDWSVRSLAKRGPYQFERRACIIVVPPLRRPRRLCPSQAPWISPSLLFGAPDRERSSFSLQAALRDAWIVGSHLPHYHTNRLARSLGHSLHPVP